MKLKLFATTSLLAISSPLLLAAGQVSADAVPPQNSKADFSIIAKDPDNPVDDNGTLVLKEVPSFSFGTIEASQIYSGFSNKTATEDKNLSISDTRLGQSDWTLTANMGQFTDGDNKLSGSGLTLVSTGSLGENINANVKDDQSEVTVATGNGSHGVDNFKMSSNNTKLDLAANPTASLSKNETFTSTINWNLSSSQPVAPEA